MVGFWLIRHHVTGCAAHCMVTPRLTLRSTRRGRKSCARGGAASGGSQQIGNPRLRRKQRALSIEPARVYPSGCRSIDDTVAGHDDADRMAPVRRRGATQLPGNPAWSASSLY